MRRPGFATCRIRIHPHEAARSEVDSRLDQIAVRLIGDEPGVMRDGQGRPIASPELLAAVSLPDESSGLVDYVSLRGVESEARVSRTSRNPLDPLEGLGKMVSAVYLLSTRLQLSTD